MTEAIHRLRAEIEEKAPKLDCNGYTRSERTWRGRMNEIRRLILEDDPSHFLSWHVIISTMARISGVARLSASYRHYLEGLLDWEKRWRPAVEETPIGGPPDCLGEFPRSSVKLLVAAVCLARFEQIAGVKIDELSFIFEFGGGYGCFRRLLDVLGFRGTYVDFDFPVMTALKRYYLTEVGVYDQGKSNLLLSDLDQLATALEDLPPNSLFLSTWAFSEAPLTLRARILRLIGDFEHFLFVYQPKFREIDNEHYFSILQNHLCDVCWQQEKIPGPNAALLVGTWQELKESI